MRVAIASGKGGTGKTTLAANLSRVARNAVLLDCDVEEPNLHLFLNGTPQREPETITIPIPAVDEALCDGCGECSRFCEYKALAVLAKQVLVFPELCHGCGGCTLVCPRKAIKETPKRIGVVHTLDIGGQTMIYGVLDVGVIMAPPLIEAVKSRTTPNTNVIIDAPPGTSCPVVAAVKDSDYVVLVTEPTPFGLHDLELAVEVMREMRLPFGVVINRADSGDNRVLEYCRRESIDLLAQIPHDRRIAEAYSEGKLMVEALPEYGELFRKLAGKLFPENGVVTV